MDIIEVCEGKVNTAPHPAETFRKNRLFAMMDKYHSYDGVPAQWQWQRAVKRLSKSPRRAAPLSQKIGKNCSDPQKKKKMEAENVLLHTSAVKPQERRNNKKVSFREGGGEEKHKLDLQKIGGATQKSSNQGKIVSRLPKVLPSPVVEVNLAAVAIEMRVKVRAADMPPVQQEKAFRSARKCFDGVEKTGFRQVAFTLKKEFDKCYGLAWHCIVGRSFGSFVTHSAGGFLYFSMDKMSILLFKTAVEPIDQEPS